MIELTLASINALIVASRASAPETIDNGIVRSTIFAFSAPGVPDPISCDIYISLLSGQSTVKPKFRVSHPETHFQDVPHVLRLPTHSAESYKWFLT